MFVNTRNAKHKVRSVSVLLVSSPTTSNEPNPMSQAEEESFFERERDRLSREITSEFEDLLSAINVLNRKFEEVLGMTKEYDTIATLWLSFYQLMHSYGQDDDTAEEQQPGMPGTGGHLVSTKPSTSTGKND